MLVSEQFERLEERYSDRWMVLERGTVVAGGTQTDAQVLARASRDP